MRAALFATAFAFAVFASAGARAEEPAKAEKAPKAEKAAKAEKAPAGPEVTLSGEMVCAKCALKETKKCQNVLKVTEGGKETKYYLTQNAVAKEQHKHVCNNPEKATVKGTVGEEGGKKTLTASEIKIGG